MSQYTKYSASGGGGGAGTVTDVTASSPLASSGGTTPDISIQTASGSQDGALSAADWTTFNNKAPTASPTFTGTPLAPTATLGDNSTQIATTAFVQSQGFLSSTSAVPTGTQANASAVTSATTTFVTALTTTVTLTATAPIVAIATATLTTTTAASVARVRTTINGVASQVQDVSLGAITTNYPIAITQLSASLAPGTYTVNFDISRLSGSGTVSYSEGNLVAEGLQGAASNGITRLTGDVTAGPGSGSQAATIAAASVTGAKIASATITGANIAATTITNSNISTVDASKITTGTLPFARGGTGGTAYANQRIPFSNGTVFTTDANFIYDTTNQRFNVGGSGNARINGVVSSGSAVAVQAFNSGTNNALQALNQGGYTAFLWNASNSALTGSSIGGAFSRGTLAAPLAVNSGDQIFSITGQSYHGAGFIAGFTNAISFVASENVTTTAAGGEIVFATTPNTTIVPVERVRVKQSGETVFQQAIATARLTTAQKNALTAAGGWVVFDTDLNQLSYYNGSTWINL